MFGNHKCTCQVRNSLSQFHYLNCDLWKTNPKHRSIKNKIKKFLIGSGR